MSAFSILFVCSGNTCRSPMAEAIARVRIDRRGLDLEAGSAGTSAWDGAPASDGALLVGLERHLDLSGHRSRLLTATLVRPFDLVLCMGASHVERAKELGAGARVHLLTAYASNGASTGEISDPFGGDLNLYRAALDEIERAVERVLDRVQAERSPGHP